MVLPPCHDGSIIRCQCRELYSRAAEKILGVDVLCHRVTPLCRRLYRLHWERRSKDLRFVNAFLWQYWPCLHKSANTVMKRWASCGEETATPRPTQAGDQPHKPLLSPGALGRASLYCSAVFIAF